MAAALESDSVSEKWLDSRLALILVLMWREALQWASESDSNNLPRRRLHLLHLLHLLLQTELRLASDWALEKAWGLVRKKVKERNWERVMVKERVSGMAMPKAKELKSPLEMELGLELA